MPHDLEHGEKSEKFQRGGHGRSLHVRIRASGFVSGEHKNGETTLPVSSRTQFIISSSTPPKQDALQLVYPCSFQTYVLPGSDTPTLIESLNWIEFD